MPKINSITIGLDSSKQVYRPGEWVKGEWVLDLGDNVSVRGVRTALKGAAYTYWQDFGKKESEADKAYEKFTNQWKTVFGTKLGEKSSGNHELKAGVHNYKFSFQLPTENLPSSYEGKYGAIRYWLWFEIERPILRFNITRRKVITVLDNIDVNIPRFCSSVSRSTEKQLATAVVLGNSGIVRIKANTDRGAYCPGEQIAISAVVNNQSDLDLGILKATLVQEAVFEGSGEQKIKQWNLSSIVGKPIVKRDDRLWKNQCLKVPAVPPSTQDRTCHIVKVSYYVKVYVDIPMLRGGDAVVKIPVTIGTIPQGHKESQPAAASNINVVDASSAITYTGCTMGFEEFSKGESRFPSLDSGYQPWCTYVPNFVMKPAPASAPKPAVSKPRTNVPKTAPGASNTSPATPKTGPVVQKTNPAAPNTSPSVSHATPKAAMAATQMVVPTAPPPEMVPPSYEEVMREMGQLYPPLETDNSVDGASISSDAETESKTLGAKRSQTLLAVRFPDTHLANFRTCLILQAQTILKQGGMVIAVAPQVIVSWGSWPAQTSLAILLFGTKKEASEWAPGFVETCENNGVQLVDLAIVPAKGEPFENGKSVFSINLLTNNVPWTSAQMKQYHKLSKELISPLRVECGGVLVGAAVKTERVNGTWPEDKRAFILSQWESIRQLSKYTTGLTGDNYKTVMGMFEECFTRKISVLFQTEDLSYIEEAVTDYSSDSGDSTEVRQEAGVE